MTNEQSIYSVLLLCLLVILVLGVYKNVKDKNILTRISIIEIASSFSITITYIAMMTMLNPPVVIYNIYGILQIVSTFCFMLYTAEFDTPTCTNKNGKFTPYNCARKIVAPLVSIDIFLLIIGCCLGEQTVLSLKYQTDSTSYMSLYFSCFHNILVWTLICISCFILLRKQTKLPSFYKEPYYILTSVALYIIFSELCHINTMDATVINLSIIGFPIEGVLMHHYSTQHRLDSLIRKSNDAVMDALNDGFILLDKDKKIIYKNHSVNDILPTDYEWDMVLGLFDENIESDTTFNNKVYLIKSRDGNEANDRYIDVSYQTIKDEKDKYVGSYFLLHDTTAAEKSRRKNDFMAKHNALTGLYNKLAFCEKAKKHVLMKHDDEHILMVFDIDKFKMINELFGNDTGDNVLSHISNSIRTYMSQYDGVFGHLGDDKFVILMRKDDFDEKLFFRAIMKDLTIEQDKDYKIIIHAGICDIDIDDYDEDELNITLFIDRAVLALADIKGDMQTNVAWYGPHITKTIIQQQKVISEVDRALDNKNICFFVQPQTDFNGNSRGGEALVRWIDPEKGIISPGEFIPVLEDKGLISKVDLYIWDLVCQKLKEWKDKGWEDYYLSVNISAKDMYYMNIYDEFTALIKKYEIKPSALRLEVTESAVMLDKGRQFELLEKLRNFGFTIEIDDFGSGYSSLNMLKDIEFDMLKIDMAFLRETPHIEKSQQIIKSIIQMAKCIGTDVITEGVETADQLEFLNSAGCDNFQGYYFDKPLPVEQFEQKYLMNDSIGG